MSHVFARSGERIGMHGMVYQSHGGWMIDLNSERGLKRGRLGPAAVRQNRPDMHLF